jgi:F-type H+-transporting ATPase subunit a
MSHAPSIYDLFPAASVVIQSVVATMLLVLLLAWRVRSQLGPNAVVPDASFSLRNFFEVMFEGIASLAHDALGHDWKKYMPLLATLGTFILVGNLMGMVPGLGGPTSFVETNLSWAIIAVLTSEAATIRVHGFGGWIKHMCPGPIWLAPLMFPVELFSHLVRFAGVVALAVPWLVMGLGVFVCFVQAFIFTFLTMLYIGMGIEEAH